MKLSKLVKILDLITSGRYEKDSVCTQIRYMGGCSADNCESCPFYSADTLKSLIKEIEAITAAKKYTTALYGILEQSSRNPAVTRGICEAVSGEDADGAACRHVGRCDECPFNHPLNVGKAASELYKICYPSG